MSDKKNFRKQFWKNKRTIGAVVPSSRFLIHKMLQGIDFSKDQLLVELGPGTGVFTRQIIQNMSEKSTLLVFEINEDFFNKLSANISDQRIRIIHDSAEKIGEYLKAFQYNQADVIISSLPLTAFNPTLRKKILNVIHSELKSSGIFIQFQYSLQAKFILKKIYKTVKISFTLLNIPPAFIYHCTKK